MFFPAFAAKRVFQKTTHKPHFKGHLWQDGAADCWFLQGKSAFGEVALKHINTENNGYNILPVYHIILLCLFLNEFTGLNWGKHIT